MKWKTKNGGVNLTGFLVTDKKVCILYYFLILTPFLNEGSCCDVRALSIKSLRFARSRTRIQKLFGLLSLILN